MTQYGGADCGVSNGGCGTVFTVDPATGTERVLHAFSTKTDGYLPLSNLVYHKGLLYGSTLYGGHKSCGRDGCGTLFSVDPMTGTYTVVSTSTSKRQRVDGLTVRGADLYETAGPPTDRRNTMYEGEPAKFNLKSGHQRAVYKFDQGTSGAAGADPLAPLTYSDGVFYGSTESGGQGNCNHNGCGTIFQYVP